MRAERDVLEHGHVGRIIDVLEGARDAAARRSRCERQPVDALAAERDLARASSGSTPVTRLKIVHLPAPFGPIRPRISPARTSKLTSLTATRPPNSLRTARTEQRLAVPAASARAAAAAGARRGRGLRARGGAARRARGQRPSRAYCSSRTAATPKTIDLEVAAAAEQLRQEDLQLVLQQRDERRAEERAPDVARAAEHRHEQVFDARVDAERRRVDGALQCAYSQPETPASSAA